MKISVGLHLPPLLSTVIPWLAVDASSSHPGKRAAPIRSPEDILNPPSQHKMIRIVYSDVDGTLVHYPISKETEDASSTDDVLRLPPSKTGLEGVISSQTMRLCRSIRHDHHTKFVLVSGMRTHTLLKRLPYLPRADAYCSEAGGRIFYPKKVGRDDQTNPSFTPIPFSGSNEEDLEAYGLEEDLEWRRKMEGEDAGGKDGFVGNELEGFPASDSETIPVAKRRGDLWSYARKLEEMGLVLDTEGYASCFRVNRKHQSNQDLFDTLLEKRGPPLPPTLATSTNLGCVDYYPAGSGKKNCCEYLLTKLCSTDQEENPLNLFGGNSLKNNALCLCDDDNDMEMAMSCHHAFLPGISSKSMEGMVLKNADQFTVTESEDVEGTKATERALELVLQRLPPPVLP